MSPIPHIPPPPNAPDPGAIRVRVEDATGRLVSDEWLLPGEFTVVTAYPAAWYVNHVYPNGTRTITVKAPTT